MHNRAWYGPKDGAETRVNSRDAWAPIGIILVSSP